MEQNYILQNSANVPIKMWTNGVPVESQAMGQLMNIAGLPFVFNHVAVMPDVHFGMGATVGSVIATKGAIIPAAVGVDIGCLDAETEFLTRGGWKKISDYEDGDEVLVYEDPSRGEWSRAFFESPLEYIAVPCEEFWHIETKYGVDQMVCDLHNVLYYQYTRDYNFSNPLTISGNDLAKTHNSLVNGFRGRFLTAFTVDTESSVPFSAKELALIVAVSADGTLDESSGRCVMRLKKQRKIDRLIYTLESLNIAYDIKVCEDGVTSISFYHVVNFKSIANLWDASYEQLAFIRNEILHWDGNEASRCFYTRKKDEADFISYAISATGMRARTIVDQREDGIDYRIFQHDNVKVGINGTPKPSFNRVKSSDGKKYCFRTSTGYFVARRNGCVFVTGNCGMNAVRLSLKADQLPDSLRRVRNEIECMVPVGFDDHSPSRLGNRQHRDTGKLLNNIHRQVEVGLDAIMEKHPRIEGMAKDIHRKVYRQIGTLGGGNHFVELCIDENDDVWVMLHSGSRGIGNCIGRYFIGLAKKDMETHEANVPDKDLSYLREGTQYYDDYVEAVEWAQDYARRNRQVMMELTLRAISRHLPDFTVTQEAINCHHNYVTTEHHFGEDVHVTRKGAVRAGLGELGIIPGSMGAKSFIVRGLGNEESFCSCSHGAGRIMSRSKAKKVITVEDHEKATEGVECRKDAGVIDESPAAYKDIDLVMAAQSDLVEIVHTLKQVVCVKG